MSGTTIVGTLLREHEALTEVVPLERIKAGALPDGFELPAILLTQVSGVDRPVLKRGAKTRQSDRVAATIFAASYREQEQVKDLMRAAAAGKIGTVGDFTNTATTTAGVGPDLRGPGGRFEKTQDFRVSFDA